MKLIDSQPCKTDKSKKWVHYNCKYCVAYVSFIVPVDMPFEHNIEYFLREWYQLRNDKK